ncbi:bifunctional diguanylate cyclase/phosphodiesterase [Paludibacterium paludis]|uniref:PAS domain S-box-containing protein/diguanylate cyclase (GGDEF)-like protein n=1 Tax=Paludibacterium paludis TaxID=1225769 RepID=A0A918U9G9_9NEIS|nr:EAL domain-containing protein [Paludibacterium paludis]GGY13679.1 hypothetical protein GCM10011289_16260 [Paludibacterium paludis]
MKLSRYLSLYLLVITLPLCLSLGWLFSVYVTDRMNRAQTDLAAMAGLVRVDLERQLQVGFAAAQSLASRRWPMRGGMAVCPDEALREQLLSLPAFSNVSLLDADGRVLCSARSVTPQAESAFRRLAFFESLRASRRAWLGPPLVSPATRDNVSYLVMPVWREGRKVGSVLLAMRLNALSLPALPERNVQIKVATRSGIELLGESAGRPLPAHWRVTPDEESSAFMQVEGRRYWRVEAPLAGKDWVVLAALPEEEVWRQIVRVFALPATVIVFGLLFSLSAGGYFVIVMDRAWKHLQRLAARLGNERTGAAVAGDPPRPVWGMPGEFGRMERLLDNVERHFQSVFNASTDGFVLCDAAMRICSVNESGAAMFGYRVDELLGQPVNQLLPESQREAHNHLARHYMADPRPRQMGLRPTLFGQHRDGRRFPVRVSLQPITTGEGSFVSATVVDLSQRLELERRIQYLSHYDMLTGLANRGLLTDRLVQSLARAQSLGRPLAVIRVYLNRFKAINDTYGHQEGDALLVEVARRLSDAAGPVRSVARLGGAEFAVLADADGGDRALAGLIDAVRRAVEDPMPAGGRRIALTAAIGIACYPADGSGAEELLKQAGFALQEARSASGGALRFYSREQEVAVRARLDMESAIREGMLAGQFAFQYQPVVDMESGRIVGAEALLRWVHPERGRISPAEMLPVAEAMGILPELEWQMRERFFREAAGWVKRFGLLSLAFNVSAGEFSRPELVEEIRGQLAESGLPPAALVLEITESALMLHPEDAALTMEALCRLGVTLAIDDFGTGYSSLSYLQSFPASRLKIDRSFVARLGHDPSARNIVSAIVSLAGNLGMAVIAEGVETELQRDRLIMLGCSLGQGYLWSPAVTAERFEAQLRQQEAGDLVSS